MNRASAFCVKNGKLILIYGLSAALLSASAYAKQQSSNKPEEPPVSECLDTSICTEQASSNRLEDPPIPGCIKPEIYRSLIGASWYSGVCGEYWARNNINAGPPNKD